MGIAKYNAHCRSIVTRYTKEWERTVTRIGRWIDFKNDYKTLGACTFFFRGGGEINDRIYYTCTHPAHQPNPIPPPNKKQLNQNRAVVHGVGLVGLRADA